MSTTALIPVEEYLRMTEKPYREYREGVLYPKEMPPKLHSIIQRALIAFLEKQGVQPFPELTVRISPTKYLIPTWQSRTIFQDLTLPNQCCSAAKSSLPKTASAQLSLNARNITPGVFHIAG